jgi:hypothetical protein
LWAIKLIHIQSNVFGLLDISLIKMCDRKEFGRAATLWECVQVLSAGAGAGAETGPQQPSHMYRVPRSGRQINILLFC